MQSTARTCPPSAKALLAVLGLALVASLPVAAKQSDRQQPANVDSKSFDGSQQPSRAHSHVDISWQRNWRAPLMQGPLRLPSAARAGIGLWRGYVPHDCRIGVKIRQEP